MARELSLQELITSSFEHQAAGINTAIPGVIVSVDNLEQLTVTVQPSVNMKFKDGQVQEWPSIPNTPLIMPSSSTSALTFPVKKGDPVIIIFSMRGTDTFKSGNGYPAVPTDYRKFDLSDAFAIPAPWPKSRSINDPGKRVWDHSTQDAVMVHNIGSANECEFRLKLDGTIQVRTNEDVEVLGKNISMTATESVNITAPMMTVDVDNTTWIGNTTLQGSITQIGNWTQTGNYTAVGIQSFNGIIFSSHKHGTSPPPSN